MASSQSSPFIVQTISGGEKYVQHQFLASTNKLFGHILQYIYNSFAIAPGNLKLGGNLGVNLHWYFYAVATAIGVSLFAIQFFRAMLGEIDNKNNMSNDRIWMNFLIGCILLLASLPLMNLIANIMLVVEHGISWAMFHSATPTIASAVNLSETIAGFGLCVLFPPLILVFLIIAVVLVLVVSIQVAMELIKFWMLMILAPVYNITYINSPNLVKAYWMEVLSICLSQIGQIILLNTVFFLSNPLLQFGALLLAIQSPAIIKQFTSSNNASVLLTPLTMLAPQMTGKAMGVMGKMGMPNLGMNLLGKMFK